MKNYKVSLTRYPEEFILKADSREQAIKFAKEDCDFSVWESEVEEYTEGEDGDSLPVKCEKCGVREGDDCQCNK